MRIWARRVRRTGTSARTVPWCSSFRLGQVHGRLAYRGLGQAQRHRRAADLEEREHDAEHHVEAFAVLGQGTFRRDRDVFQRQGSARVAAEAEPVPGRRRAHAGIVGENQVDGAGNRGRLLRVQRRHHVAISVPGGRDE